MPSQGLSKVGRLAADEQVVLIHNLSLGQTAVLMEECRITSTVNASVLRKKHISQRAVIPERLWIKACVWFSLFGLYLSLIYLYYTPWGCGT